MFRFPRPLVVGLGIAAPALMIVTAHPWIAAVTFTVVFSALLLRPRDRAATRPAAAAPARELVPSGPTPAHDTTAEQPRPVRDGLIHYPPRRL